MLTFLSTYQKDHFTSLDVLPFTFLNYPPQTYHPSPEISSLAFSRSKTPSPKTSSLLFADVSSSIRAAKIRRAYGAFQNYPPLSLSRFLLIHHPFASVHKDSGNSIMQAIELQIVSRPVRVAQTDPLPSRRARSAANDTKNEINRAWWRREEGREDRS